jgi:hypothetical protein
VGLRSAVARVWDLYAWSRGALWLAALLAPLVVLATPDPDTQTAAARRVTEDLGDLTDVWARWDSVPLLGIAIDGYDFSEGAAAFYPLYPGILAILGRALGGHYVLAGLLVSLVAGLVAFALLDRLALPRLGEEGARRAVLLLAVFPASFFLTAVYGESLFLALVLAAFLLAERERFAWAWLAAGLALLTRPFGVALLPALAVLAWRSERRWRNLALGAIAPAVFTIYPLVLWQQLDDPFAFRTAEDVWGRELTALGPLQGLWDGARAAWGGILQLTVGSDADPYWTAEAPARAAALNLEYAAYLLLFAALTVVVWQRFGTPYGLYAAVSLAIPLSLPQPTFPLLSLPRFGLVVFPFFLALAALTQGRPRLATAVAGTSAILLGVGIVRWSLEQFVA